MQSYYDYFNINAISNSRNKSQSTKSFFKFKPQMLVWSFLKSKKPNWTISANKSIARKLAILRSLSHFISIICIVSFVYSILQLWLDSAIKIDMAEATILNIEQTEFKIKNFVNHFKIGFGYDILLAILLISFAGSFPLLEKYKAKDNLKKYNKSIKNILYFLTISTSFTFFGNRFASAEEGKIGKLEIHKLQISDGNKLLLKKIRDAVTDKVVGEILSNPEIDKVLAGTARIKKNIDDAKEDHNYKAFISVAPQSLINNLPLSKFDGDNNGKYDFETELQRAEIKFENSYSNSSEPDYYEAKTESDYTNFKERNKDWFNEKESAPYVAADAERTFEQASAAQRYNNSNYYQQYKEPIEKILKKGYRNTAGKWVKEFFVTIGIQSPFLYAFIDPIIHEPIEDFITKTTARIFKSCVNHNAAAAKTEFANCSGEFREIFNNEVTDSQKFTSLAKQIVVDLGNSNQAALTTKSQINAKMRNATDYLLSLEARSRWEQIRIKFFERVNSDYNLEAFSARQKENFKRVINDWNTFKEKNKLHTYLNSVKSIEDVFFEYSESDGDVKATWGFILQQEDWAGAVEYYTKIKPDATATGKPYYLLKYYYDSIGKGNQISELYDSETENGVGAMCPH